MWRSRTAEIHDVCICHLASEENANNSASESCLSFSCFSRVNRQKSSHLVTLQTIWPFHDLGKRSQHAVFPQTYNYFLYSFCVRSNSVAKSVTKTWSSLATWSCVTVICRQEFSKDGKIVKSVTRKLRNSRVSLLHAGTLTATST